MREVIHWQPQPGPQTLLLSCPVEDLAFGGARGGGKTDGLLGDWLSYATEYGEAARGVIFRKSYPELEEVARRAREIYLPLGGKWKASSRTWDLGGAELKLRFLASDDDADAYQGHSYSYIGFDELGNWSSFAGIDKLRACMRSPHGIPCYLRNTANPGGRGHNLIRARYVAPAPPRKPFVDAESGIRRVFIPSLLDDNKILTTKDPDYWKRVVASANGREDLIKAWRWGLWDIVAGGFFDDLFNRAVHVIKPFDIPPSWRVDRSFDWGSSKPYAVQFWAESDGTQAPNGRFYPRGTLFLAAQIYGWNGRPNEGLRRTATEIGRQIREAERGFNGSLWKGQRQVLPGPADPSIFATENGNCIAEDMGRVGVRWEQADNSRVPGWEKCRELIKASLASPMEEPGVFFFDTCTQFLRTFPVLPRDERKPDDVDSEAEDHDGDAFRYRAMARRHTVTAKKLKGT